MKTTQSVTPIVCGAAWLGIAIAVTAAEQDPGAEAGWAAVKRCAQQETERAVHSCLTQVLREAGLLTPEVSARQQQRAFGLPQAAPPPPSPTPPAPVKAPTRTTAAPAVPDPAPPPDRVDVQIAAVTSTGDGRLIITTSDGAVWRQAESLQNPQWPRAGEQMTIRKGTLGSYRCTLPSKLSWRCTRSR
jgi:hypothetical protein